MALNAKNIKKKPEQKLFISAFYFLESLIIEAKQIKSESNWHLIRSIQLSWTQPFDTIKTKMQAQKGYENLGMIKSFKTVFVKDGFRGLYR